MPCRYVEENGTAACVAQGVHAGMCNIYASANLGFETRADVTRSPKHRYQWPHKKNISGSKGGARDTPPPGFKFFQFRAVFFWKFWQDHTLALPPGGLVPLLQGILDLPLKRTHVLQI